MLYQYGDLTNFRTTLREAEELRLPEDTVGFKLVLLMRGCGDKFKQVRAKAGNKRIMPLEHQKTMEEFFNRVSSFKFLKSHMIDGKSALELKVKKNAV